MLINMKHCCIDFNKGKWKFYLFKGFYKKSLFYIFSEAKAVILGPTDLYVKMGSIVTLTCVISQGPHDLGTINWHRGKYYFKILFSI